MSDVLTYGPPALAWMAVVYKLPALLRNPRDPALRVFWLALAALALSLTTLLPPLYLTIDRLAGGPNLARLLGHGLMLVTGWAVLMLLFHLTYPDAHTRPRTPPYVWILAGTLVVLTGAPRGSFGSGSAPWKSCPRCS